jgi:hypothetical protein
MAPEQSPPAGDPFDDLYWRKVDMAAEIDRQAGRRFAPLEAKQPQLLTAIPPIRGLESSPLGFAAPLATEVTLPEQPHTPPE